MKRIIIISISILFCSMYAREAVAQTVQNKIEISGLITDNKGEALVGAVVTQKGVNHGTVSDVDGKFKLTVSSEATLIVSYIGYKTKTVPVGGKTSLSITLEDDVNALDEIVVVGFGEQKKVNLTGAVGVAKAKDLETRPVAELTQSLQGLVPGLEISKNSGSMEKSTTIKIRGTATIGGAASDAPLVLIDGVESEINSINPADVENISVLKDAGSAAIYGSRGANGVVLITTKSGQAGKVKVSYSNNFRWNAPLKRPQMLNSYDFVNYFNEAYRNTSSSYANGYVYPDVTLENILLYQQGLIDGPLVVPVSGNDWGSNLPADISSQGVGAYANTDWYAEVYKDWGFSQEHNANISGGSQALTYFVSLNYMDQDALLKLADEGMKRYSVNGKFSAEVTKNLTLNYSSRFVRQEYTRPNALGDGLYENLARQLRPNMPLYDNNGNLYSPGADLRNIIEGGTYNRRRDYNTQQMSLVFEPVKNWQTTADLSYRVYHQSTYSYALPTYSYYIDSTVNDSSHPTGSVSESSTKEDYMTGSIRSKYSFSLAEAHHFSAMGGFQFEDLRQKNNNVTAYGILNLNSPQISATSGLVWDTDPATGLKAYIDRKPSVGGSVNSWATAGFFGRVNYDYLDKYLVEINARYDGTSRFRAENRWKLYPSISLGWKLADENFMDFSNDWLDILKLRASWGSLGNQSVSSWYPTYSTMSLSTAAGSWLQNSLRPNTAGYPSPVSAALTWQTNTTLNGGLDWGFFGNRLTGSFDIYQRNTTEMIGPAQELPAVYGQTVPAPNNLSLKTSGFEFEIAWRDKLSNGLSYGVKATLSDSRTYITSYPNDNNTLGEWWRNGVSYRSGLELGELWGYETVGIAKTQAEMDAHLDALDANYRASHGGADPSTPRNGQSFGSNWGAGDIMYKDVNGDGIISAGDGTLDSHGDIKVIGNNRTHYFFGIDLTAAWKGFDFRAFFQGVMKRDYWTNSYMFWGAYASESFSTGLVQHLDYFRPEDTESIFGTNTDAYYPRASFDSNGILGRNRQPQTRYLQDASYIRLKNLQIGYTIPEKWTKKFAVQSLRFYVSGENLWTGTNLAKMFDPETIDGGKSSDTDWRNTNNGNAYPLSKVFSCGLTLNF